jgi:hypothetical protein
VYWRTGARRQRTAPLIVRNPRAPAHLSQLRRRGGRTFPNLAGFLHRSGCRAALLSPATFGRFPGDAVGAFLRQLFGLGCFLSSSDRADSRDEFLDDLVQWYREETGAPPLEDPFQAAQPAVTAAAKLADPCESVASGHAEAAARQLHARGAARRRPRSRLHVRWW